MMFARSSRTGLVAVSIAGGLAALAGCATAPASRPTTATAGPKRPTAKPTSSPAPVATGPQACVTLNSIREAKVVDDRTIDFYMSDRRILRNTLPNACPQLNSERSFSYSTSISRLCSVDVITVIIQGGGPRTGASCGLGPFVPYTPIPTKKP